MQTVRALAVGFGAGLDDRHDAEGIERRVR
jgi:hypothetical protein